MLGTMLILRGKAGHYDGRDWPRGALYEQPALHYAKKRGYVGRVLDIRGDPTGESSPQTGSALTEFDKDPTITALYGFSAGGYNVFHVLTRLKQEYRDRLELVVVLGAPDRKEHWYTSKNFKANWKLVYRTDPPEAKGGHMGGPQALADERVLP